MDISTQTPLNGAHVVVFGGSSGIGLATAAAAKAKGAIVTLIGRTPAKLEAAARKIGGAQTAIADIAERKSVEAVFNGMTRVDHLVITAGVLHVGKLADSDPDQLLVDIQQRIAGAVYAIKVALPSMPPTGSIVLMGGQYSDRPSANGGSITAAAIRGIEALARSLALNFPRFRGHRLKQHSSSPRTRPVNGNRGSSDDVADCRTLRSIQKCPALLRRA